MSLYPTPADQSVGDRPPLTPYAFRPGGFWQTQKALLFPAPADQSVGDQPPLRAYGFRKGGFWRPQQTTFWPQLTDPLIVTDPPPPPPTLVAGPSGGSLGRVVSDSWYGTSYHHALYQIVESHNEPALIALFAAGELSEDDFIALLAAMRTSLDS